MSPAPVGSRLSAVGSGLAASGVSCSVDLSLDDDSIPAAGATATVTVSTQSGCAWQASAGGFVTIVAGASGAGPGTVSLTISSNPSDSARQQAVVVAGHTFTLTQAALAASPTPAPTPTAPSPVGECAPIVSPLDVTLGPDGGVGGISVSISTGCDWSASSGTPWINVTGGATGSGPGTVSFSAAANTGGSRSGLLTVAGESVTVRQDAAGSCAFSVTPALATVGSSGGSVSFDVAATSGSGCTWTAAATSDFLSISSGGSGTGSGTVVVAASANSGGGRSGTVTIASQTVIVSQAAPSDFACGFGVSPSTISVASGGATIAINVTNVQGAGCSWTASSSAPFATITSGAPGNGNGTVMAQVTANAGAERTAVLVIAGLPVTVTQAGSVSSGCVFTVAPGFSVYNIPTLGGPVVFQVANTQGAGCNWSASSNSDFLSITAGASGTGSGAVTVNAGANTGAARSGTVTIAGLTRTVTQDGAACAFTVTPSSTDVTAAAGSVSFTVTNTHGVNCGWTATTSENFLSVTGGASGTGSGTVTVAVATNTREVPRTGEVSIAGTRVSVTQAAPGPCEFSVTPASASVGDATGSVTFTVTNTVGTGCGWTARSETGFLSIASGASGAGDGTVTVAVGRNLGATRTGEVTIAGLSRTVTQARPAGGPCAFSVTPDSFDVGAGSGSVTFSVTNTQGSGCAWEAVSFHGFLSIASGASGTGNGTVTVNVAANTGVARDGGVGIANQGRTVRQAAAAGSCAFSVSPSSTTVGAGGAAITFTVTKTGGAGCSWTAVSNTGFLSVTGGASGTSDGTVTVSVGANTGNSRSGSVTIAGQTVNVTQDSGLQPCAFSVSPPSTNVAGGGGSASFTVTVTQGSPCSWNATSNSSFLTLSGTTSGTGGGTVTVHAATNTGAGRSGTVTIAGQTVTVTQDATTVPCVYSVSPSLRTIGDAAGSVSFAVTVTQGTGCNWTASTSGFLSIASGASGTGSGTVVVAVAANTGAGRSGTVTIAGETVTVSQAAPSNFG